MKMKIILALSYWLCCTLTPTHATVSKSMTWSLGLEGHEYIYHERFNNSFFMRDQGKMLGAYVGFQWFPDESSWFIEPQFRAGFDHKINYKSNGTGTMKTISYEVYENRFLAGYRLELGNHSWEPYTGFAHRLLINDDSGRISSTGHSAYYRESNYIYLPIGLRYTRTLQGPYQLKAEIEYDYFIKGEQISSSNNGSIFEQDEGFGSRASVSLIRSYPSFNMEYTLFARYWHIQDSDEVQSYVLHNNHISLATSMEPDNRTLSVGLRVGIQL